MLYAVNKQNGPPVKGTRSSVAVVKGSLGLELCYAGSQLAADGSVSR